MLRARNLGTMEYQGGNSALAPHGRRFLDLKSRIESSQEVELCEAHLSPSKAKSRARLKLGPGRPQITPPHLLMPRMNHDMPRWP